MDSKSRVLSLCQALQPHVSGEWIFHLHSITNSPCSLKQIILSLWRQFAHRNKLLRSSLITTNPPILLNQSSEIIRNLPAYSYLFQKRSFWSSLDGLCLKTYYCNKLSLGLWSQQPPKWATVISACTLDTLVRPPPSLDQGGVCDDSTLWRRCSYQDFQRWVIRGIVVSSLAPWITCPERSQLPFCGGAQAALWKGSRGKPTSTANSQEQHVNYMSEARWKQILQVTAGLLNILSASSWQTLRQKHPAQPLLYCWPTETMRDNKCLWLV